MKKKQFVGEFEQMVLLALLQLEKDAYAPNVVRFLDERIGRPVSRGALYRTLDRMENKQLVSWEFEPSAIPERGGHPTRRLHVTETGLEALRHSRYALETLWNGLGHLFEKP